MADLELAGQIMAFAKTTWHSNTFKMTVDVKMPEQAIFLKTMQNYIVVVMSMVHFINH